MPRKRVVTTRFWIFAMISIAIIFFLVDRVQGNVHAQKDLEIISLREKKEQIEIENKELARKIEFTKTNTYIERVAHEKLGLLKPDEIRLVEATGP